MRIPDPYFEDVPNYGDLSMEQIIVEYVYPLLSVLTDNSGQRYLCLCFDTRGAQRWIVTPISTTNLVKLLKNELSLSEPFENTDTLKINVIRDYSQKKETFSLVAARDIPKENLPTKGEFLDSETGEWDEYIAKITRTENYVVTIAKKLLISSRRYSFRMCVPSDRNDEYNSRPSRKRCMEGVKMCYARQF